MGKFLVFILAIFAIVFFFSPQKVRAADADIVINEVYPNPKTGEVEWIELFNKTDFDIDLADYTIEDGTGSPKSLSSCIITADSYLVLLKGSGVCKFGFALNNDGDTVKLKKLDLEIDKAVYGNLPDNAPVPAQGESIARTPNGHDSDNDAVDFVVQSIPTPGAENPTFVPPPPILPLAPTGVFPEDYDIIPFTDKIVFKWETVDTNPQNFEFILSDTLDFSSIIIDEPDLTNLEYEATNLVEGIYYWQVIASNTAGETASPKYKFTIYNPTYSDKIIINELMPNPSGDDATNEWIELYNNSDEVVDLNGWQLSDLKSSIHNFTIFNIGGTIIEPHGYLVFYRSQTGITLNNDQDGVRIYQPNGNILYETSVFADGDEDLAWARTSAGKWSWTEKPTPGAINNIYLTPENEGDGMGGMEDVILNTVPIGIKTGDFRDFDQKLIAVTGTVISTSGNTFYLDDGSGQAKIYIQDKTGIDKPPMHKGDLFEVIGIVDLYRSTWRILPQKQSDIKLIHCIKDDETAATTSKSQSSSSTTASSTAGKTTAQARAPTSLVKEVKAAENTSDDKTDVRSSFRLQILEALTGLAIIFLILLIIKIRRFPKVKVIGGHFGDDET